MFRQLLIALAALPCLAEQPPAAEKAAPPPPSNAIVWSAHDPAAVEQFSPKPGDAKRMVDALILAATGASDIAAAWRTLVKPGDRVGIKVSTAGGPLFSTRVSVVEAVLDGLEKAGVKRSTIIVWDRSSAALRAAGYDRRELRCQVRGIDPPAGYDRTAKFTAPTLGKLIWGDLLFHDKKKRKPGQREEEREQLSSASHLATVLSRDVAKVINIPVLTDDHGCGVAGALYSMTVPNLDNWRRFLQPETGGCDAIPALYADERIGPKVVLHLLDGLIAQYAGGPEANLNYAFAHATIYASRDPVALDATAARLIDEWRKAAKLPPLGKHIEWLPSAETAGLGIAAPERIELRSVTPPR